MISSRLVAFAARAWSVLTILVFVGVAMLLASGYRATRDWEQGVATRIAHQTEESADLIIKAISRDMRGAQATILANRDWDAPLPADTADLDITEQVATTFARYPYPESFFTWRGGAHGMIFFSRSTRLPPWMPRQNQAIDSPITAVLDPPMAEQVRQRVLSSVASQLRYVVFDTVLAGVPYQVIARVTYVDPLREHLESVSGFTVNLDWVRTRYFADILTEVGPTASGGLTQDVALLDEDNHTVFGSNNDAPPMAERAFHLLFMDSSDTASDLPPDITLRRWRLRVSASRDPMLLSAHRRADTTLLAISVAAVVFGVSLVLARRTVMKDAKLSEMRSRFVSSVTHDLKTPLANIHALAATLARESQVTSERYRAYPHLVMQEATNLGRLVDNLLAYARITDVTEAYAFEPMAAAELVDDALKSFQLQWAENRIRIDVETPVDLPFVRADQRAMVLALKNLIDNALRHARSGTDGGKDSRIRVAIRNVGPTAFIEVEDDGCGISAKKLAAVRESIASRAFAPTDGGGLGLAIASKVIADHGGTLTVDSAVGIGTRCVIGLPVC
jgi:signal transduction histidine kinase